MQTDPPTIEDNEPAGAFFAQWALWTILIVVLAWDNLSTSNARYLIYALSPLLVIVHLVLYRFRPRLDGAGLTALALYAVAAAASLMVNPHPGLFTQRDLLIIFGYFVLLSLHLRAPRATADIVLIGLIAGLALEIAQRGITLDFAVFGPQGMIESNLAFPLGVLLLYYLSRRQWGRALIAAIFLIVGSKRIAIIGVLAAVGLDMLIHRLSPVPRRRLFLAAVILCAVVALFSEMAFTWLAQIAHTDVYQFSLGRYSFASVLWDRLSPAQWSHWLFGFGPGGADGWLAHQGIEVNPHNDWLKILFDYGFFGLALLIAAFGALFPRTRLGNMLYLYTAVLMITDNTFIYLYHYAILFLIIRIVPEPARRAVAEPRPMLGPQAA